MFKIEKENKQIIFVLDYGIKISCIEYWTKRRTPPVSNGINIPKHTQMEQVALVQDDDSERRLINILHFKSVTHGPGQVIHCTPTNSYQIALFFLIPLSRD